MDARIMRHSKKASVLGATLVISLAITVVLAGMIKWVDAEKRITRRHMLSAKAKYAAEAVCEYAAAQIRSRLEYQTNFDQNEFTPGANPPQMPTDETLGSTPVNLITESGIAGIPLLGGLPGDGGGGEPSGASPDGTETTSDELFASSFSSMRWEVVTASSPLYSEDPLRGQKVFVREISVLASASVLDKINSQTVSGYAEQVIQVRDAPLFGFAMFYNLDLEIMPGPYADIFGPVHTNRNLYVLSGNGLKFHGVVTSAGKIIHSRAPGDPLSVASGYVHFRNSAGTSVPMLQNGVWVDSNRPNWTEWASQLWQGYVQSAAHGTEKANPAAMRPYVPDDPLTLANELKNSAHLLIEPATPADSPSYPGDNPEVEKLATKACLVIDVSSAGVPTIYKYVADATGLYRRNLGTGTASYKREALKVPSDLFVGGGASLKFTDKRWAAVVAVLDIDVGRLKNLIEQDSLKAEWTHATSGVEFNAATEWNGVVYVHVANTTNGAIRLVNGGSVPNRPTIANGQAAGFTIATNAPAYIKGNYNADGVIAADASAIRDPDSVSEPPAAVIADAITILSGNWNDAYSTADIGVLSLLLPNRRATQTEVAAAIVSGIVPTNKGGNATYSGGVENLPRFLENWSSVKFGYRGSMVVLYESEIATAPWGSSQVYSAPTRILGFNKLYENATFPPGRLVSRSYRRLAYRSLNHEEFQQRLAAIGAL